MRVLGDGLELLDFQCVPGRLCWGRGDVRLRRGILGMLTMVTRNRRPAGGKALAGRRLLSLGDPGCGSLAGTTHGDNPNP
jgi:hypothetical protein